MTTKTKVQVDGPAIVLCKAITFHDRLKNSPEILKKMPYFLGDLLDLCCGVEKCSKALLISPIVGKILLLWLWLWLLLGDWKSESPLFSRPKTMLWTTRCVAAHLLGSWFFLVEKDAEFSAAQLKGSMISWAKWPMFQVLGGATKRYRCLGSRCYPCQPPPNWSSKWRERLAPTRRVRSRWWNCGQFFLKTRGGDVLQSLSKENARDLRFSQIQVSGLKFRVWKIPILT